MQQPRRHDQQVESAILGNLATCLGKRVVVQYVDRQPSYIGMVRRMGPPVPGIDAVKSPRRHELIHKRGNDTAAASDHQGALAAHMLLTPAMTPLPHPAPLTRRPDRKSVVSGKRGSV